MRKVFEVDLNNR